MKAACTLLLSLKSQQDAERMEHRKYNGKARDEVMRLRRQLDEADRQLKSEMQKAGYYAYIGRIVASLMMAKTVCPLLLSSVMPTAKFLGEIVSRSAERFGKTRCTVESIQFTSALLICYTAHLIHL